MTPRHACHCGLALIATAETTPSSPRRRWVCPAGHSEHHDDTEPLAPAPPPRPPAGQMGLF